MPGKIFVNYRRDDVPGDARGVRDGLAAKFGKSSIFMDVDNLLVGQRFDIELARALDDCDMLLAIIGPRWVELMKARTATGERDYVREEIAEALKRKIAVVPVRVGREGNMPTLPRPDELPEDIRELVLYQKHDVAHERFGRDMAELVASIVALRKATAGGQRQGAVSRVPWGWISATAASVLAIGYAGAYYAGVPVPWPTASTTLAPPADTRTADAAAARTKAEQDAKARADEVERLRVAAAKADEDRKRSDAELAKLRADADARRKADEEARAKAAKAEEGERQRLAALKAEEDRQRAAADAKRKADDEAARRVPQVGQVFRDCNDGCPEMLVVPAGSFTMGSPPNEAGRESDEGPQRQVTIRQPFAVGKFEVTFADWEACVSGGGCTSNRSPADQGWGKGRRPVINVSWNDAKEYVAWLSRKTGKNYRLLTEAEWEYAARAGTQTLYAFGDKPLSRTQAQSSTGGPLGSAKQTVAVGQFPANKFGLHDMHGNVWEWCEDNWHPNYQSAPTDGSVWQAGDLSSRLLRGGSWFDCCQSLASGHRHRGNPTDRYDGIGLRVGRTLTP